MRKLSSLRVSLALAAVALSGCQQVAQRPMPTIPVAPGHPVTYALSVTVAGGLHPTPSQWAAIQSTFSRLLAAQGLALVSDVGLADRILRIDFTPDPEDPENRGRAAIVGVRVNDQRDQFSPPTPLVATYYPYPSPFGWNGAFWGPLGGFGFDPFYGYGNAYYDGYTYATPSMSPRKPAPPRDACVTSAPHPHRSHHPRPPLDPGPPRRGVPPADEPAPAVLAASEPARPAAAPRAYPSSDPRTLVFSDDIRRRTPTRFASSEGSESGASHAASRTNGTNSGSNWSRSSSTGSETGERSRTYTRHERDDPAQSRSGTNATSQSYARGDSPRSRSDEGQRQSSGSSSYTSSSASSYHTSSSGHSSSSSYSDSSSASSSSGSSFSSGGSFSSGSSGAAAPSGGSGPSAAPTTSNQAEK
jgi:hypothetical protein